MRHVIISNTTKHTTIATDAEQADTFLTRGRGLMGRTSLPQGGGLVIVPCSNIHMFWMRFAIDVIFLDKTGRVLKLYPALAPWKPYAGARGAHITLELPTGAIAASKTEVGDTITIGEKG